MTASVNGWRVIGRRECSDVQVPGGILPVHPELAWLAWDCANLWHETVEPLVWPGCWGWAEPRPIRGAKPGGPVTNHASGTAWDLCAPLHPRGVAIGKTFSPLQLAAVERLEARYFGVLDWGGRWSGKDVDGMHWEARRGVTVEAVRHLTDLLRHGGPAPAPPPPPPAPAPAPPPPAPAGWTGPDLRGSAFALRGEYGNNGPRTAALQDWLRRAFPLYAKHLAVDGWWGDQTTGVVRDYAHRSGVRSADGRNVGPQLARKLYLSGFRG
jgi:hypothetical protein